MLVELVEIVSLYSGEQLRITPGQRMLVRSLKFCEANYGKLTTIGSLQLIEPIGDRRIRVTPFDHETASTVFVDDEVVVRGRLIKPF